MPGLAKTYCRIVFLLCCVGCARSGVPEQVASEPGAAGGPAPSPPLAGATPEPPVVRPSPPPKADRPVEPPTSLVDACGRCPLKLTRKCLCEAADCPRDFADAVGQVERWDAYGEGCSNVWLVERTERRGFNSFTFDRANGALTLIGRYAGDPLPGCALVQEELIMSDGMAAECARESWCTFPGIDHPIGIGELDEAPTCDIDDLARTSRRSGRR